jgi:hypothetical protein
MTLQAHDIDPELRAQLASIPREAVGTSGSPKGLILHAGVPATAPMMAKQIEDLLEMLPHATMRRRDRRADRERIRLEAMRRLVEAGFSKIEIAGFLNRDRATVSHFCHKHGMRKECA